MNEDRMKMILEMLQNNPDDSFLKYAAALEYKKHYKIESAIVLLTQLAESDPDYLATYYQLGKLLQEQSRFKEAAHYFSKGLDIARSKNENKTVIELSEALLMMDSFD